MGQLLLRESDFLLATNKLKPRWDLSGPTGQRIIAAFEDAGAIRPRVRIVAPQQFAAFRGMPPEALNPADLDSAEVPHFQEISAFLDEILWASDDPEQPSPLDNVPEALVAYVLRDPATMPASRADWQGAVTYPDGSTGTMPCAFSFYAPWQVLRLWVLLDAWTWDVLIDPMSGGASPPRSLHLDPSRGLPAIRWARGELPFFPLINQLETDGWLQELERAAAVKRWHDMRVHTPDLADWKEGECKSTEERLSIQRPLLLNRYRTAGRLWLDSPDRFVTQVKALRTFYVLAEERRHLELAASLRSRLHSAVRWMMALYQFDFPEVCRRIGPNRWEGPDISAILRPGWFRSVGRARILLPHYVRIFNETMQLTTITKEDTEAFVQYLDDNGLSVWCSELATLNEEFNEPSDMTWEHRLRTIVALASLSEPILLSLNQVHGTRKDSPLFTSGDNKRRHEAFLLGRPGAKSQLADLIEERWSEFTQTTKKSVIQVLGDIDRAVFPPEISGPAKAIFRLGAIRNFGSHQFDADPAWISKHQQPLVQAVVLCPLFYWKLATSPMDGDPSCRAR